MTPAFPDRAATLTGMLLMSVALVAFAALMVLAALAFFAGCGCWVASGAHGLFRAGPSTRPEPPRSPRPWR